MFYCREEEPQMAKRYYTDYMGLVFEKMCQEYTQALMKEADKGAVTFLTLEDLYK